MPLIKEIEAALPIIAELPKRWQQDVALMMTRMAVACDNTLIKTPEERQAMRDQEMENFKKRFSAGDS